MTTDPAADPADSRLFTDLYAAPGSGDPSYVQWWHSSGHPIAILNRAEALVWLADNRSPLDVEQRLARVDQTGSTDPDGRGGWAWPVQVAYDDGPDPHIAYEVPRGRLYEYSALYLAGDRLAAQGLLVVRLVEWQINITGQTRTPGRRWLLWDVKRGAWWRRGPFGYTLDIGEARRFSRADAIEQAGRRHQPDEELIPVPEPTGQVVIPTGLEEAQLREFAAAIDRQLESGHSTVSDLVLIRTMLGHTVRDIGPGPKPTAPVAM